MYIHTHARARYFKDYDCPSTQIFQNAFLGEREIMFYFCHIKTLKKKKRIDSCFFFLNFTLQTLTSFLSLITISNLWNNFENGKVTKE